MITIVSGLPRSGTSMLMRMLEAGKMDILSDNIRQADESNPKGYFEYEKIKSLRQDCSWMQQVDGKTIKIIAQLLQYIPLNMKYKIIFMERDIDEIMASQTKMLERMGKPVTGDNTILKKIFSKQIDEVKSWIEQNSNLDVLYLRYAEVIKDPFIAANEINLFLDLKADVNEMASKVDSNLYRERG